MVRRHARPIAVLAAVVLLLAVAGFRFSPLWPGPALPTGATRLRIATEAPHLVPTLGCPTALLAPGRVATEGDELILLSEPGGLPLDVIWPSGWAAWRLDGHAELVSRDGALIGREGDVLDGVGGGVGADGAFHVCVPGG